VSVERDELVRLAAQVPDDEVAGADLRERLRPVGERCRPPAWFRIAAGQGSAVRARGEELAADGFGR
jgi:hypothetical protein